MDSIQASESSQPREARARRRFSRTFSRARWPEYGRLLKGAIGHGYSVVSLEDYFDGHVPDDAERVMILRHDVDQDPGSALVMSDVEAGLGLRSTWYFRWRTADADVIAELRRRGGEIGLHYETLTRAALNGSPADARDLESGRRHLREEIAAFEGLFGPIRSVAAHGDTRAPGIRNADLMRGEDWRAYGVDYDANDAMRRHRLAAWLTDRAGPAGSWGDGADAEALLSSGETPILCLTHPNNWGSGLSLWRDRIAGALRRSADEPPR